MYDLSASKAKIKLIMTQQYNCGKTNHYFYHVEKRDPVISDRSDNHLWMIYAVYRILCEEGNTDFLFENVDFYDGGAGTVLEHLKKSVEYTVAHLGEDGIPLMLGSDWNDMLVRVCTKGKGESVFVSQMLILACKQLAEMYSLVGKDASELNRIAKVQAELIDRFIRAVGDDGVRLGAKKERCASIWINSQSWAVICGAGEVQKCNAAMDTVMRELDCGYGLLKLFPPLEKNYPSEEYELSHAQPGIGENGGVFCHTNAWAIIALCMLGRNNDAYKIYNELIPHNVAQKFGVETYGAEPYIYSSNIRGPMALCAGKAGVSWLTGTASWMMIALTDYIFGIRPRYEGLEIKPCVPDEWKEIITVTRKFRGTKYTVFIDNRAGCGNNVKSIKVINAVIENGKVTSNNPDATIYVTMG